MEHSQVNALQPFAVPDLLQHSLLLDGKNGLAFQELFGALDLLAAEDFYFVIFMV